MLLLLICILFLSGLPILLMIQPKTKASNICLFPLLMGIGYHSTLFLFFSYLQIYYNSSLFIIMSLIIVGISIFKLIKKKAKIQIENDLKKIPIYYILFIIFILYRFIIISQSSFVNFNNWDELRCYQYISKKIFITHNMNYIFELFAPMTYFLGTMTYEFCGVAINNPRIYGGLFYIIMSLFIYSRLKEFKVNCHISALLSMLFIISSAEVFLYYITFYNNVYYSVFLLIGMYLLFKTMFIHNDKSEQRLSYIFLFFACLTRREAIFHIIATLIIMQGYLLIKKRTKLKNAITSLLPFITFAILWNVFSKIYTIHSSMKNYAVIQSLSEKISERLNISGLASFGTSAFKAMFNNGQFSSNYLIFAVTFLVIIICIIKIIKNKTKTKNIEFLASCVTQIFIYFGIVFLTALCLFSKAEYLSAASFSRYMLMVTPISFICLGVSLFENTETKKLDIKKEKEKLETYKVLLIIPAYNEEENIKKTFTSIQKYNKKFKVDYDVIVINDGSTDNTQQILEEYGIPHINLVHNLGIGGAVQTGYKYAEKYDYNIAIQFDGDGQHDINYVKHLIEPIVNGKADMVIGSRFIKKDINNFKSTWIRRIGINLISSTIKLVTKKKIYDPTSGFRAVNKEIISKFAEDYPVEYPEPITEVRLLNNGYIIEEQYAKMHERTAGKSSITKKIWSPIYYMINVILSILIESMVRENDK